jgi:hypothetical protein
MVASDSTRPIDNFARPRDDIIQPLEPEGEVDRGWNVWGNFARAVTCCFVPWCLGSCGKMKDSAVQQAWREKVVRVKCHAETGEGKHGTTVI